MEQAAILGYPDPPPGTTISLTNALPNLQLVRQGIGVNTLSQTPGLPYTFDGFPKSVVYVGFSILALNLNTTDLSFMSNILCAPQTFVLGLNFNLASLSGLNIWPSGSLRTLVVRANPQLSQTAYQPLGAVLQCQDGSSPQNATVRAQVFPDDCDPIQELPSVDDFCLYLRFGC